MSATTTLLPPSVPSESRRELSPPNRRDRIAIQRTAGLPYHHTRHERDGRSCLFERAPEPTAREPHSIDRDRDRARAAATTTTRNRRAAHARLEPRGWREGESSRRLARRRGGMRRGREETRDASLAVAAPARKWVLSRTIRARPSPSRVSTGRAITLELLIARNHRMWISCCSTTE